MNSLNLFFVVSAIVFSSSAFAEGTCVDSAGHPLFGGCMGTCHAGPINPADTDMCQSETGLHVSNGFDKAYECAKQEAISACLLNGSASCHVLTYQNLGFQGEPGNPNSGYCEVRVYAIAD